MTARTATAPKIDTSAMRNWVFSEALSAASSTTPAVPSSALAPAGAPPPVPPVSVSPAPPAPHDALERALYDEVERRWILECVEKCRRYKDKMMT